MSSKTDTTRDEDDKKRNPRNDEANHHAREQVGKIPNRDKDEFTKGHLKEPEIDIETEEMINEKSDQG